MTTPEERASQLASKYFSMGSSADGMLADAIAQAIRSAEAEAVERCAKAIKQKADQWHAERLTTKGDDGLMLAGQALGADFLVGYIRSLTVKEQQ